MYEGQIIAYHVHPFFSIPLLWVTEITNVREPFLFIDEQRYGPYRMWHHQHRFHRVGDGVQVEDTIDYIMPAGPLGLLIRKLFVAKQLETVFSYRARVLAERFGVLYS